MWSTYRRYHLMIVGQRDDEIAIALARAVVDVLAGFLPTSRALLARAADTRRVGVLIATNQQDVAILAVDSAESLVLGKFPFDDVRNASLRVIASFGSHVLVCRPDFMARNAYLLARTLVEHKDALPSPVSAPGESCRRTEDLMPFSPARKCPKRAALQQAPESEPGGIRTMDRRLENRIAVVTGGSSGIGLGIARQLVVEGATVFITGRRQTELDDAVKQLGLQAIGVQGDVSKLADLDRLYDGRGEGRAGRRPVRQRRRREVRPARARSPRSISTGFGINVKGLLFTVQKALPLFADGGSIILNASIARSRGCPRSASTAHEGGGAVVRPHLDGGPEGAARSGSTRSAPGRSRRRASTGLARSKAGGRADQGRARRQVPWAGWATRTRSPRSPCSSPPTTAASSRASSCSSTAGMAQI